MNATSLPETYDLLRDLVIPLRRKGYQQLAIAIHLVTQDEDLLRNVTKGLYPMVAELCHTTRFCVEHNIRTVITDCWEGGGKPYLEKIAKRELDKKPTAVQFIEIIAVHLMRR